MLTWLLRKVVGHVHLESESQMSSRHLPADQAHQDTYRSRHEQSATHGGGSGSEPGSSNALCDGERGASGYAGTVEETLGPGSDRSWIIKNARTQSGATLTRRVERTLCDATCREADAVKDGRGREDCDAGSDHRFTESHHRG